MINSLDIPILVRDLIHFLTKLITQLAKSDNDQVLIQMT